MPLKRLDSTPPADYPSLKDPQARFWRRAYPGSNHPMYLKSYDWKAGLRWLDIKKGDDLNQEYHRLSGKKK
jgi:hypothetical protein